jgi:hypothetical protein
MISSSKKKGLCAMKLYSTIEEKFCVKANKNVAIEMIRYADGTKKETCLHQNQCGQKNCEANRERSATTGTKSVISLSSK